MLGFRWSEDEKFSIGRQRPEDIIAYGKLGYDGKSGRLCVSVGGVGECDVRKWETAKVRGDAW